MPNVNASKIDWPSESTETHWPPTVQGSGDPAGMARGAQRREWSLPVCKIKGGFMEEVVSGWGLEGTDFESSPSPLAWSPGQAEYVMQRVLWLGWGQGNPHSGYFGHTGQRANA